MAELQLTGEDEALVALLEKVDGLYAEQQRIAKSMRKGFLNITKARQSMGRNALSALVSRTCLLPTRPAASLATEHHVRKNYVAQSEP